MKVKLSFDTLVQCTASRVGEVFGALVRTPATTILLLYTYVHHKACDLYFFSTSVVVCIFDFVQKTIP